MMRAYNGLQALYKHNEISMTVSRQSQTSTSHQHLGKPNDLLNTSPADPEMTRAPPK